MYLQDGEHEIDETPLAMYETQKPHEMMAARVMDCRTQYTTVQLDITQYIFDELYLVQKIDDLHVQNI
jgi:hypothetical protein